MVFQLQQVAELLLIQFVDALVDILREDEIEKSLKLSHHSARKLLPLRVSTRSERVIGASAKAI